MKCTKIRGLFRFNWNLFLQIFWKGFYDSC